jgi:prolipoprotein diacylglyceryltransferase
MYPRFGELIWITPYGLALVLACALCFWLTRRRARAAGWDVSHIDFALPLAFVGGALGAKLLAVLFFDRLLLFALLLAAVPILWLYCRSVGLSFLQFGDLLAPPLLLWLAVLRIGCFFAGCCWGDVVDTDGLLAFSAVTFPAGSLAAHQHAALGLIESGSPSLPVVPTQLLEAVALVGLYVVLIRAERTPRVDGAMLFATLGAYAALRFAVEFLRADNPLVLGPLTGNQLVCAPLLGIAAWWWFVTRPSRV